MSIGVLVIVGIMLCALVGAAIAGYQAGYSVGLRRARELEELVDGPVDWERVKQARDGLRGWVT